MDKQPQETDARFLTPEDVKSKDPEKYEEWLERNLGSEDEEEEIDSAGDA